MKKRRFAVVFSVIACFLAVLAIVGFRANASNNKVPSRQESGPVYELENGYSMTYWQDTEKTCIQLFHAETVDAEQCVNQLGKVTAPVVGSDPIWQSHIIYNFHVERRGLVGESKCLIRIQPDQTPGVFLSCT